MDAGLFGYWVGGFIIPMLLAFVLLRLASRNGPNATTLRWIAVLGCAGCLALGIVGGGFNLGSLIALVIAAVWAFRQKQAAR